MTTQTMMPSSTGDTASRPSTPDIGWTHWNTDTLLNELWTGSTWLNITGNARSAIVDYIGDNNNSRNVVTGFGNANIQFVVITPLNSILLPLLLAVNHDTTTPNVGVFSDLGGTVSFDAHAAPVTTFSFWNNDTSLIRVGVIGPYNDNGQAYRVFFIVD